MGLGWNDTFLLNRIKFSRRFLDLVFRAIEVNSCHLWDSIWNIQGKTLFSYSVLAYLTIHATRSINRFVVFRYCHQKIVSFFKGDGKFSHTGQVETVPIKSACFGQSGRGVNQIWCPSLSDVFFLPERTRGGGGRGEFSSAQVLRGQAFLSFGYHVLSRVWGLTESIALSCGL